MLNYCNYRMKINGNSQSLKELNKESGREFTEKDFENATTIKIGGFGEWVFDAKRKDYE